ncbi:unnamed protein product, partial [Nesidiocoris tenuis]
RTLANRSRVRPSGRGGPQFRRGSARWRRGGRARGRRRRSAGRKRARRRPMRTWIPY